MPNTKPETHTLQISQPKTDSSDTKKVSDELRAEASKRKAEYEKLKRLKEDITIAKRELVVLNVELVLLNTELAAKKTESAGFQNRIYTKEMVDEIMKIVDVCAKSAGDDGNSAKLIGVVRRLRNPKARGMEDKQTPSL